MGNRWPSMKDFGMSDYAYRELFYFCLQYNEKRQMLGDSYDISAISITGMPKAQRTVDSVFYRVDRIIKIRSDIELIEAAAEYTDEFLYPYILKAVTENIPYEYLNVPCGRRQFYAKKKLFYHTLHRLKEERDYSPPKTKKI